MMKYFFANAFLSNYAIYYKVFIYQIMLKSNSIIKDKHFLH